MNHYFSTHDYEQKCANQGKTFRKCKRVKGKYASTLPAIHGNLLIFFLHHYPFFHVSFNSHNAEGNVPRDQDTGQSSTMR